MNLTGKIALVTGASRGIGRAIALELSKAGASVIINYSKDERGAQETIHKIKELGGYAIAIKTDIKDYKCCSDMIDKIIATFGKLDILINNAGISKVGLFIDMEEEDWDGIIDSNLKGVFNVTHNAVKHMLQNKSGSIINISSIWGNSGASCEVIYSASKGGINSFTKALAKELGPSYIRVNAIAPGVIKTEMNSWLNQEEIEAITQDIPLGKLGEVEDIAKLALFLCSEASKYITGQVIVADGGML